MWDTALTLGILFGLVFVGYAALLITLASASALVGFTILFTLAVQRRYETALLVKSVVDNRAHRSFCLYLRPFRSTGFGRNPESADPATLMIDTIVTYDEERAGIGQNAARTKALEKWEETAFISQPVELMLAKAMEPSSQLVGLGRARDFRGIGVFSTEDSGWQAIAAALIDQATLIVVVPGSSEGMLWEFEYLAKSEANMRKTVFLVPPHGSPNLDIQTVWTEAKAAFRAVGWSCPKATNEGIWFKLGVDGQVIETAEYSYDVRETQKLIWSFSGAIRQASNLRPEPVSCTFEPLPWWIRTLAVVRAFLEGRPGSPTLKATVPHP